MENKLTCVNCPVCGKPLLNLNINVREGGEAWWYWCDDCHIDITVTKDCYAKEGD
jgi:hypothetical protein